MTRKEIKLDIEKRIIKHGVIGGFESIVSSNIEFIAKQLSNVPYSEDKVVGIANMAISFSIDGYRRAGIINKLYNDILYKRSENVVEDAIMEYAINKTKEILT